MSPQSKGLVEYLHQSLKATLRAYLSGPMWMGKLPMVLFGLQTDPKDDLHTFPAYLALCPTPLQPPATPSPQLGIFPDFRFPEKWKIFRANPGIPQIT